MLKDRKRSLSEKKPTTTRSGFFFEIQLQCEIRIVALSKTLITRSGIFKKTKIFWQLTQYAFWQRTTTRILFCGLFNMSECVVISFFTEWAFLSLTWITILWSSKKRKKKKCERFLSRGCCTTVMNRSKIKNNLQSLVSCEQVQIDTSSNTDVYNAKWKCTLKEKDIKMATIYRWQLCKFLLCSCLCTNNHNIAMIDRCDLDSLLCVLLRLFIDFTLWLLLLQKLLKIWRLNPARNVGFYHARNTSVKSSVH